MVKQKVIMYMLKFILHQIIFLYSINGTMFKLHSMPRIETWNLNFLHFITIYKVLRMGFLWTRDLEMYLKTHFKSTLY